MFCVKILDSLFFNAVHYTTIVIRVRMSSSPRTAGAGYSSGGKFRFPAEYTNKFIIFDELVAETGVVKKSF